MPTPRPIIASISGEKMGTLSTWLMRSSNAKPIATPNSAVMIGRPIATTDPNAMSMINIAARIPMPSLDPGAALTTLPITCPPRATE